MEILLFDEVADALRGLVPDRLGPLRVRARRHGIKVWFGPEAPPREHYEAQVIGAAHVADASVLALEIGFHAEHPQPAENDKAMAPLRAAEKKWRPALGGEAHLAPFLGRQDTWRRLSETWADPDLSDTSLGLELALRLTDYVTVLEPLRRPPARRR